MGKLIALSDYRKENEIGKNIIRFRPMSTGISPDGNLFIYNYLVEISSDGALSEKVLRCLLCIFRQECFEFIRRDRIDAFASRTTPEEIDPTKTEEALLVMANEESEQAEEYAQAYISYSLLRHVLRRYCETRMEKDLLIKWHSYLLCLIFPKIFEKQSKK